MPPDVGQPSVVVGDDGLARCAWAVSTPDYVAYHDEEWGRPVHGDLALFERISLEAFQSGLSWLTILRKRDAFRGAFAGFDPEAVAAFGAADEARLLQDVGIVRNRAKISATITNARAVLALTDDPDFSSSAVPLDALWWGAGTAAQAEHTPPQVLADVPARTASSTALARDLKRRSFAFVGPTTVYAAQQATGVVDDHLAGCHRAGRSRTGAPS